MQKYTNYLIPQKIKKAEPLSRLHSGREKIEFTISPVTASS